MGNVIEAIVTSFATIGFFCVLFLFWEAQEIYKRLDRMRMSGAVKPDKKDSVDFEKWLEHIYGITGVMPKDVSELTCKFLLVGMCFSSVSQGVVENATFFTRLVLFIPSLPFFAVALYFYNKNPGN
jgi:hypothetical protein